MEHEGLQLLVSLSALFNRLLYYSDLDFSDIERIEKAQKEIGEYLATIGWAIGKSDLAGWGLFPLNKVE